LIAAIAGERVLESPPCRFFACLCNLKNHLDILVCELFANYQGLHFTGCWLFQST
jgi:hypothetical protein